MAIRQHNDNLIVCKCNSFTYKGKTRMEQLPRDIDFRHRITVENRAVLIVGSIDILTEIGPSV